jgi:hypothetical protein
MEAETRQCKRLGPHVPSADGVTVPSKVGPSNSDTVRPASATSIVPLIVCDAWFVRLPFEVIDSVGALESGVHVTAALVPRLPAPRKTLRISSFIHRASHEGRIQSPSRHQPSLATSRNGVQCK